MKAVLFLSFCLGSLAAKADLNCGVLAKYIGAYQRTSTDCDPKAYSQIQIQSQTLTEGDQSYIQTWIRHNNGPGTGGFGIGPTNSSNDIFKCRIDGNFVSLEDPLGGFYTFAGSQITYTIRGCYSLFEKRN